MFSEIARRAIATYSDAGDLVIDVTGRRDLPALHEAVRQARTTIAVTPARHRAESRAGALVLHGDPCQLPHLLAGQAANFLQQQRRVPPSVSAHPAGCADLILAAVTTVHRLRGLDELLAGCAIVLRPGGYLAIETTPSSGRDPGTETVARCARLGLRYWQHVVCLLVPIEDGQLTTAEASRCTAQPPAPRVVHSDLHVFRKPPAADARRSTQARCAA